MPLKNRRIAFIGAGHITEMMVSNLARTGNILTKSLIASDPVREKMEKLRRKYGRLSGIGKTPAGC